MPVIRIAEEAGACYGVERALAMVEAAVAKGGAPVKTLGPLIHNPRVVDSLKHQGVSVVDSASDAAGAALLLRTHGVTPEEERIARDQCAKVMDATCPFVKKAHAAAELLAKEGYAVYVVGEAGHPEVEATLAHVPGSIAINSADDVEKYAKALRQARHIGLIVQTTMSASRLNEVVSAILPLAEEVRVMNTICEATAGHQDSCRRLAQQSDVMIVIGGRISANTTRLAEIASQYCPRTHHIEGPDELLANWFEGAENIGITAGASTPESHIKSVYQAIATMVGAN